MKVLRLLYILLTLIVSVPLWADTYCLSVWNSNPTYDPFQTWFTYSGANDEHKLEGFVVPDKDGESWPMYWVGLNGSFQNRNEGHPLGHNNATSATATLADIPLKAYRENTIGLAAGAVGTLHIYDNSNWDNLYIEFTPAGYGMRYGVVDQGGWKYLALHQTDTYIWESDVVQATREMINEMSFWVGLKATTDYVFSSTMSATQRFNTRVLNGVTPNTFGHFRININTRNNANNWNVEWVADVAEGLTHTQGYSGRALLPNGMQDVYVLEQNVYVLPGQTVNLNRPDYQTFKNYVRWFDYNADAAAEELSFDRTPVAKNASGAYYTNVTAQETAIFQAPTTFNNEITIACDQSAYSDGVLPNRDNVPEWYQVLWYMYHGVENGVKQTPVAVSAATIAAATPNIGDRYHVMLTRAKKGAGNFLAFANSPAWNGNTCNDWSTKQEAVTYTNSFCNAGSNGYNFYLERATNDGGYYLCTSVGGYYLYFNGATTTIWSQTEKSIIYLEAPETPINDDANLLQSADPDHIIVKSVGGKYLGCSTAGGWNSTRTFDCLPMDAMDDFPITEPTLSQRIIYHIKPAGMIADQVVMHTQDLSSALPKYMYWAARVQTATPNSFTLTTHANLSGMAQGAYNTIQLVSPLGDGEGYMLAKLQDDKISRGWSRDWVGNSAKNLTQSTWFTTGDNWEHTWLTFRKTANGYTVSYEQGGTEYYASLSNTGVFSWETEPCYYDIVVPEGTITVGALSSADRRLFALRAKNGYYLYAGGMSSYVPQTRGVIPPSENLTGNDVTWLEEQNLIAPVGATTGKHIYVGPNLQWKRFTYNYSGSEIKMYYYDNAYYYQDGANYKPCNEANGSFCWRDNGVAFTPVDVVAGKLIRLPDVHTPGVHTYTLQFTPTAGGTAYNICKITVNYHDITKVGPYAGLGYEQVTDANTKLLAEENFNFDLPNTTSQKFYSGSEHQLPFDQSSYGYYYAGQPHANRSYPFWGEFGFVNRADFCAWAGNGSADVRMAQHTDDKTLSKDEAARLGYMLYVDGSLIPGEVFSLDVATSYCPGAKVYCSAWVGCQSGSSASKPNLEFTIMGYYEDGLGNEIERPLTTFVTGTIVTVGEWQHILFPVSIPTDQVYTRFRLKVINRGDFTGNDFVIDDIRLYVKNPPIMPVQASSAGCIEVGSTDVVPTYLRFDYQSLVASVGEVPYYYTWTDKNKSPINATYLDYDGSGNITTRTGTYGRILLKDNPDDEGLLYENFTAWDAAKRGETASPGYGYVREKAADGGERYFLYISQPLTVQPNHTYYAIIAGDDDDLNLGNPCAKYSPLTIIGGAQVLVDGGAYVDTTNVCGNKIYTLQGSMSFMVRKTDPETGEVSYEATAFECPADWLVGSEAFIDACHTAGTGEYNNYTFAEIDAAIKAHTELGENPTVDQFNTLPEAQRTIINWLVAHKMLTLGEITIDVNPVLDGYGVVSEMHYMSYPVHKQFDSSLSACPNPQDIKFNLPDDGQFNGIGIGTESANLPNRILHEPRRIRIQASEAAKARITLPIHLLGNQGNNYTVEQALLFQTNDEADLDFEEGAPVVDSGDKVKGRLTISPSNITSSVRQITLTGTALRNLKKGKEYVFYIDLASASGCDVIYTYFQLQIIPDVVTLKEDATVWNSDESWVEGYAPLPGTSVVLPATAVTIPTADQVLNVSKGEQLIDVHYETGAQDYITYDVNYVPFACKDIYLPVGACLMNQTQLTIGGKAYIDVPFTANKWQMASFPIQGVVSGDVFIPQSENSGATHPFSVKEMTTPADRYLHPFYHNLYNASVVNTTGSGSCEETVTCSTWLTNTAAAGAESGNTANGTTIPYGYVAGGYNAAALWLDEAATGASGAADGVVRLPKKADATYSYYDKNTHEWIGYLSESVTRSGDSNYGKPAYTNGGGQTFTLRGNTAGTVFLFGNPTLAYIDMGKFMAANSSVLTGTVYRYDGSHYVAYKRIGADGSHHWYLPPYSAVLVEKSGAAATAVDVTISNAMLSAATPETPAAVSQRNSVQSDEPSVQNTIFITAQSGEFTTYAAAIEGEGSNLYDEDEDAEVFLMAPEQTPFTIYTTADNHALAINRHANLDYLPVCLYSNEPAMQGLKQTTYLTFSGDNEYLAEWDLVMLGTTKQAALKDGLKVKIGLATDGTPNIALQHTRRPITTSVDNIAAPALHAFAHQGTILVYADQPIGDLQIYTPSGQLIYQKQNVGTMHEIQLPEAVYVLRTNGQAIKLLNY